MIIASGSVCSNYTSRTLTSQLWQRVFQQSHPPASLFPAANTNVLHPRIAHLSVLPKQPPSNSTSVAAAVSYCQRPCYCTSELLHHLLLAFPSLFRPKKLYKSQHFCFTHLDVHILSQNTVVLQPAPGANSAVPANNALVNLKQQQQRRPRRSHVSVLTAEGSF